MSTRPAAPLRARVPLRLDQALQLMGVAETGGHAKVLIQEGAVQVDGAPEGRRGRKLHGGERVEAGGKAVVVTPEA